jgi:hypothetical protein
MCATGDQNGDITTAIRETSCIERKAGGRAAAGPTVDGGRIDLRPAPCPLSWRSIKRLIERPPSSGPKLMARLCALRRFDTLSRSMGRCRASTTVPSSPHSPQPSSILPRRNGTSTPAPSAQDDHLRSSPKSLSAHRTRSRWNPPLSMPQYNHVTGCNPRGLQGMRAKEATLRSCEQLLSITTRS